MNGTLLRGLMGAVLALSAALASADIFLSTGGDISQAITDAVSGETIWLGDGTYTNTGSLYFQGKVLTIKSLSGSPQNCVVDLGGSKGFQLTDPSSSGSTISGIKIGNGLDALSGGAALEIVGAGSILVENCIFVGNSALGTNDLGKGGAVFAFASYGSDIARPFGAKFVGCCFNGNTALAGTYYPGMGGAVCVNDSNFYFQRCDFTSNGSPTGSSLGGGVYLDGLAQALFENCAFNGNAAEYGGAIYSKNFFWAQNCAFAGNCAADQGGAVALVGLGFMMATNCTFAGNEAWIGGGGAIFADSSASGSLANSIVCGNMAPGIGGLGSLSFDYCNVEGNGTSGTNIDSFPYFNAMPGAFGSMNFGDLRLQSISPCRNTGSNALFFPIELNVDLDDRPRIAEGNIDMGAYEFGDAVGMVNDIKSDVDALVSSAAVLPAQGRPLKAKLDAAVASIAGLDYPGAIAKLQDFINQCNAMVNARRLTRTQADELIASAQAVIGLLGGP